MAHPPSPPALHVAQDAVQKNMKQSKTFWSKQEEQAKQTQQAPEPKPAGATPRGIRTLKSMPISDSEFDLCRNCVQRAFFNCINFCCNLLQFVAVC